jgi:hypothetical protein
MTSTGSIPAAGPTARAPASSGRRRPDSQGGLGDPRRRGRRRRCRTPIVRGGSRTRRWWPVPLPPGPAHPPGSWSPRPPCRLGDQATSSPPVTIVALPSTGVRVPPAIDRGGHPPVPCSVFSGRGRRPLCGLVDGSPGELFGVHEQRAACAASSSARATGREPLRWRRAMAVLSFAGDPPGLCRRRRGLVGR